MQISGENIAELELNLTNQLIIHPAFNDTIKALNDLKIDIPRFGSEETWDFSTIPFPKNGEIVTNIDDFKSHVLDANNGQNFISSNTPILAYDESIQNFLALEGVAYFFSHSIILHGTGDYLPSVFISFYFFTRSKLIKQKSKYIIESENPLVDSKKKYASDRTEFILNTTPKNSIILIDGPLIGGQISNFTVDLNKKLLKRNIFPIFIVKNSNSNLITQNIESLKDKYNSDMHWSYRSLKIGERTNYFSYIDRYNKNNGKVFCYLKPFDVSPQRIEMHVETYKKYQTNVDDLMDLIYYLMLAQGNYKNPQVRSIAVAEKFARESLKLFNIKKIMRKVGLKPTINESRF